MSFRILIICDGFYPLQNPRSFRATELAKELVRRGMDVSVMCPNHKGLDEFLYDWSINHIDTDILPWKLPTLKGNNKFINLINRISSRLLTKLLEYPKMEFFFSVRKKIKPLPPIQYDILISIAVPYPIHWGVASIWKKGSITNFAKVWIADCGDPYYIQENDKYKTPFYFKWVEKWFMNKADYITIPTHSAKDGYFQEFHSKLEVIPQGFKFEDVQTQALLQDDVIRFAYAGGFTVWRRDPAGILEFLTNLDKDFKFEFHIYTLDTHFVEIYSRKDSRIFIHDFKPRLELLFELSQFDFMLNLENFGNAQTPSKLIDYYIIQKPILSLKSFDLDLEKLNKFLNRDYTQKLSVENVDNYRIENVVDKMILLFNIKL